MSSETIRKWKPPEEEITPYKIAVSAKYLDLTKQKLALTRLPRELSLATSSPERHWSTLGTPKSALEPLLDKWLDVDEYDWRKSETVLNDSLEQWRTSVSIRSDGNSVRFDDVSNDVPGEKQDSEARRWGGMVKYRLHFVHHRFGTRAAPQTRLATIEEKEAVGEVVPLLYVHGVPGSFTEIQKVVQELSTSTSSTSGKIRGFHVVAPSIPGFGFSDAATAPDFGSRETMRLFDALMTRLGYDQYVVVCASTGWSVGRWWCVESSKCAGVLLMREGPIEAPVVREEQRSSSESQEKVGSDRGSAGRSWKDVFKRKSIPSSSPSSPLPAIKSKSPPPHMRPQTLAHALTDSPSGLLAYTLCQLHTLGNLEEWTDPEILDLTMLGWLPGPEAALRWSWAVAHESFPLPPASLSSPASSRRPRLGVVLYHSSQPPGQAPTALQEQAHTLPIDWTKTREGHAGIPPHDHPTYFITDIRFFAEWLLSHPTDDSQKETQLPVRQRSATAIRHTPQKSDSTTGTSASVTDPIPTSPPPTDPPPTDPQPAASIEAQDHAPQSPPQSPHHRAPTSHTPPVDQIPDEPLDPQPQSNDNERATMKRRSSTRSRERVSAALTSFRSGYRRGVGRLMDRVQKWP